MKEQFKTLFSTDSVGRVRQWNTFADGADIVVRHGVVGGKITEKRKTAKPKNIGKINETTAEEQAIIECEAKHIFQIDREDYHPVIELANRQLRPMLALDYHKVPHRVMWNQALAQPKLDGLRLTVGRRFRDEEGHEMMSRKGEVYVVPHLVEPTKDLLALVNTLCDNRCLALDGEAYIHGMPLQQITSLARKYREGETEKLQYWLFDLVIPDMPFAERYGILRKALKSYYRNTVFELVPVHDISNETEMKYNHGMYTELGFEGLMIRHADSEYGIAKRSPDLFKYKHFFDEEACINDVWEDDNGNAMLTVTQKNGMVCKVTPKRTHEERKVMLEERDQYLGKWITVKYQTLTDDGVFQFPVGLGLRECDSDGNPLL